MGNNRIDPRQQFSKKLAWWTSVFWFLYMSWLSCIMMLQPGTALYVVYMSIIISVVMVLNVWAYTKNSIYEKGLLMVLDKAKLEMKLQNTDKGSGNDEENVKGGDEQG